MALAPHFGRPIEADSVCILYLRTNWTMELLMFVYLYYKDLLHVIRKSPRFFSFQVFCRKSTFLASCGVFTFLVGFILVNSMHFVLFNWIWYYHCSGLQFYLSKYFANIHSHSSPCGYHFGIILNSLFVFISECIKHIFFFNFLPFPFCMLPNLSLRNLLFPLSHFNCLSREESLFSK